MSRLSHFEVRFGSVEMMIASALALDSGKPRLHHGAARADQAAPHQARHADLKLLKGAALAWS
jgi:hypothetical protein